MFLFLSRSTVVLPCWRPFAFVRLVSSAVPLSNVSTPTISTPNASTPKASIPKLPADPKLVLQRVLQKKPPPVAPKRAVSAVNFYVKESYSSVLELPLKSRLGELSKRFRLLDESEKKVFEDAAAADAKRYNEELTHFYKSITATEVATLTKIRNLAKKAGSKSTKFLKVVDPKKPKRPLSAYILFCRDMHDSPKSTQIEILGVSLQELKVAEMGRALGAAWRNMPAARKQEYDNQYQAEMVPYKQKLAEYNEEHAKDIKELDLTFRDTVRLATFGPPKPKKKIVKKKAVPRRGKLGAKKSKKAAKKVKKVKKVKKAARKSKAKKPVNKAAKKKVVAKGAAPKKVVVKT